MINTAFALAFAGQGAQFAGMGADIYAAYPAARKVFDEADKILGYSLSSLCFQGKEEDLTACAHCQPAIFTMSASILAVLQESPGFTVVACGGLSLGEWTALVAAGCCDFPTALRLVQRRGQLMDEACRRHPGAMAAVLGAEPAEVETLCRECDIDIANLNCPGQIVVSGLDEKVTKFQERGQTQGLKTMRLNVAGAYHSRLMQEAADEFRQCLQDVALQAPSCLLVQNFPGTAMSSPDEIKENLCRQITGTVRWESCLRLMLERTNCVLEIGPGKVQAGLLKRISKETDVRSLNSAFALQQFLTPTSADERH